MYIILWKCCCTIVGRKHLLSYWSRSQRPHKCTRGPKQRQNCARVWCVSSPLPSLRQTPTTSCTLFYNTCDATLTTVIARCYLWSDWLCIRNSNANIKKWLAIIQYYQNFSPGISIFFRVFIHNIYDIQTHQTNAEYLFVSHILPAERNPELWTWNERSFRYTVPRRNGRTFIFQLNGRA